ncbi:MAG: hypothetical protein A3J76_04775 [Candidatus Moranbacteria bacterium RBG_13_45_13]|nr:MAG: hypothetical protein A3J76_04775 [Candidatus Moranbacteria bacterium RBG_13_45_13]
MTKNLTEVKFKSEFNPLKIFLTNVSTKTASYKRPEGSPESSLQDQAKKFDCLFALQKNDEATRDMFLLRILQRKGNCCSEKEEDEEEKIISKDKKINS